MHFSVPPKILPLHFGQEITNEGGFAQLACVVTEGDEPLSISWTFHGSALDANLGIYTTPLGTRGSSLMILRVGRRHTGKYSCQASNIAGKDTESVELEVNGEN